MEWTSVVVKCLYKFGIIIVRIACVVVVSLYHIIMLFITFATIYYKLS